MMADFQNGLIYRIFRFLQAFKMSFYHDKWVYFPGKLMEITGYCFHRANFIKTSKKSNEKVWILMQLGFHA